MANGIVILNFAMLVIVVGVIAFISGVLIPLDHFKTTRLIVIIVDGFFVACAAVGSHSLSSL